MKLKYIVVQMVLMWCTGRSKGIKVINTAC